MPAWTDKIEAYFGIDGMGGYELVVMLTMYAGGINPHIRYRWRRSYPSLIDCLALNNEGVGWSDCWNYAVSGPCTGNEPCDYTNALCYVTSV